MPKFVNDLINRLNKLDKSEVVKILDDIFDRHPDVADHIYEYARHTSLNMDSTVTQAYYDMLADNISKEDNEREEFEKRKEEFFGTYFPEEDDYESF